VTVRDGIDGVRVLVTGAAGFVGVNLCRALTDAGAEVHGTVRPGGNEWRLEVLAEAARVHALDLADAGAVAALMTEAAPEVVFHAAEHSAYDRAATLRQIVSDGPLAAATVVDAASRAGVRRVVLLGSSLVYGKEGSPYREDHPLLPDTLRGASKGASSLLTLCHARERGLPVTELRLFSVYGPWEPLHRLVPRAVRAALLGEELPLTAPGLRHDLAFVGDVAEACLAAMGAGGLDGEVIHVASGHEASNEEIVRTVEEVVGRPVRVRVGAHPAHAGDRAHWQADVTRAAARLGWTPRHSLPEGIAATARWLEAHLGAEAVAAGPRR